MDNLFISGGQQPPRRKQYNLFSFIGDVLMIFITGGLWLIWIFVREMRR